jgi:hypothetical protein
MRMNFNGHPSDQGRWIEDLPEESGTEQDIIKDIFPPGLSLMIGYPKAGKTNFLKQAAIAIATGQKFMNEFDCQQGRSYLALYESSKKELRKSFKNKELPPKTIKCTRNFIKGEAGLIELENIIARRDNKIIVVDTFAVFKGSAKLNDYTSQYKAFEPLNKIAEETNTALVVVTHTKQTARKHEVGSAGFRCQGLRSVAPSTLVLDRDHRNATADLRIEARMGRDQHLKLHFDQKNQIFSYLGEVDENRLSDEMVAILKILYKNGDRPFTPSEIADDVGTSNKSAYNILQKLIEMKYVCKPERGLYLITNQGIVKAEKI